MGVLTLISRRPIRLGNGSILVLVLEFTGLGIYCSWNVMLLEVIYLNWNLLVLEFTGHGIYLSDMDFIYLRRQYWSCY